MDPELESPGHLVTSHTKEAAHLWRAKKFPWSSADWDLVSDQYVIGEHDECRDGVKGDGTYDLYEKGIVSTFSGPLEEAGGKWQAAGTFPSKLCDDIGIYVEDGRFHLFGEHGDFPHGPDGTRLAHYPPPTVPILTEDTNRAWVTPRSKRSSNGHLIARWDVSKPGRAGS